MEQMVSAYNDWTLEESTVHPEVKELCAYVVLKHRCCETKKGYRRSLVPTMVEKRSEIETPRILLTTCSCHLEWKVSYYNA